MYICIHTPRHMNDDARNKQNINVQTGEGQQKYGERDLTLKTN